MLRRRGTPSRREFLQTGAVAMIGAEFAPAARPRRLAQGSGRSNPPVASVKALVFDTFGTVVDWRTSVTQEVEGWPGGRVSPWTERSSPTPGVPGTVRA